MKHIRDFPDTDPTQTVQARRARLFQLFRQQANATQAGASPAETEPDGSEMDAIRRRAVTSLTRTA